LALSRWKIYLPCSSLALDIAKNPPSVFFVPLSLSLWAPLFQTSLLAPFVDLSFLSGRKLSFVPWFFDFIPPGLKIPVFPCGELMVRAELFSRPFFLTMSCFLPPLSTGWISFGGLYSVLGGVPICRVNVAIPFSSLFTSSGALPPKQETSWPWFLSRPRFNAPFLHFL